jgi:hypothetical protein
MLISIVCIEPFKLEPFIVEVDQATLERLDDEENYILINPATKQCFVNGEWINLPQGRIQADGQIEVHNAG